MDEKLQRIDLFQQFSFLHFYESGQIILPLSSLDVRTLRVDLVNCAVTLLMVFYLNLKYLLSAMALTVYEIIFLLTGGVNVATQSQ